MSADAKSRSEFLNIVRALSQQEYDAHRKAFDDLEAKANWLIGYTGVSTAIAAWLTTSDLRGKPAMVLLLEALFLFIAALVFALVSMHPREIAGPPSAAEALAREDELSPGGLAHELVAATDYAIYVIADHAAVKIWWLAAAYYSILAAYAFLLLALGAIVLS